MEEGNWKLSNLVGLSSSCVVVGGHVMKRFITDISSLGFYGTIRPLTIPLKLPAPAFSPGFRISTMHASWCEQAGGLAQKSTGPHSLDGGAGP